MINGMLRAALVSSQDHLSLIPTLCCKARLQMLTPVRVESVSNVTYLCCESNRGLRTQLELSPARPKGLP